MNDSNPKSQPLFILNLVLCVTGTLAILWFAIGVEQKNSRAQIIFEWMLDHSTPIVVGGILLMVLIAVVTYFGVKSLKKKEE